MSQFQSKKLKELQNKWYGKLKKEGFKDIEKDGYLINWDSQYFMGHYHSITFEAKETYYRYAAYFLNEYKFKNHKERKIWELHTKGVPIRDIALKMNIKKWVVEKILNDLTPIMIKGMNNAP